MSSKPVTKCACFDRSFEFLRDQAVQSVAEIAGRYGCTTQCGLCRPYIERMLATGETAFEVIESSDEA
jgi:bacterioferritin-associated ferredoxin